MNGLVFIAIVIFIFIKIAKSAENAQNSQNTENTKNIGATQSTPSSRSAQNVQKPYNTQTTAQNLRFPDGFISRELRDFQKSVNSYIDKNFSETSQNGTAFNRSPMQEDIRQKKQSTKPKAMQTETDLQMSMHEGECIEPDADHCAVKHEPDSVYASEITDCTDINREKLINGIIMAEILSEPKCFKR